FGDDSKETVLLLPPDTVEINGEFTDNPFSHIVNGQKNTIKVTFDNKGENNYTINLIGGALVNKDNPSEIFRVAYNGTVTVVDPDVSIFDLQLLFMWLILIMAFGGFVYMIYQAFFAGVKPKKTKRAPVVKTENSETGPSDLKYDESWIPEHHLKPQTRTSP
ncbi:16864_t:CDS:2, partial [Funneliformis caledonium]